MSASKFNFVSPGVFIDEIDNSQRAAEPRRYGPVIIGRTPKGPGMRPVRVNSLSEYVEMFGAPVPGGENSDQWRNGNYTTPMYATYAAYAWLKNNSPVTMVRLLGVEHDNLEADVGNAGWEISTDPNTNDDTAGGAYGLFVMTSGSNMQRSHSPVSGALAAVWYLKSGVMELTGTALASGTPQKGAAKLIQSNTNTDQMEFTAMFTDTSSSETKFTFNFNENSSKFIRKVFNTNPTITNTNVTTSDNTEDYFLGETFEDYVKEVVSGVSGSNTHLGVILALKGTAAWSDQRVAATRAETGWFFGQDLGDYSDYSASAMKKLFKLVSLDGGEWLQNNIKVSITDLQAPTTSHTKFGSFSVVLRTIDDKDSSPKILEVFTNCNLNPNSSNYVARKIGDVRLEWDEGQRRYVQRGSYENRSKYVYVELNDDVDNGSTDSRLLPFGVEGPLNYVGFAYQSGSANLNSLTDWSDAESNSFAEGSGSVYTWQNHDTANHHPGPVYIDVGVSADNPVYFHCTFPKLKLKHGSRDHDLTNHIRTYWGVNTYKTGSSEFDPSVREILRSKPNGLESFSDDYSGNELSVSWRFSLDELSGSKATTVYYSAGTRAAGTSITSTQSSSVDDGWEYLLAQGFNRFTTCFHGGADGFDITEKDPFRNSIFSSASETNSYEFNSVKRAIDAVADPELVEFNLAVMPGITNNALTDRLMDVCSTRGDALAIIDLDSGYADSGETRTNRDSAAAYGEVDTLLNNLKARNLNNSYGCSYYPWVQVRDTISDSMVWVPPSVAALGTMASAEKNQALWFAPAGFTRGGLSQGAAGIPVTAVREHLRSSDRDRLYTYSVNPIASFPAEGIVVFGQKTLQSTASSLDRINVRRLLIHVKKEVSKIAATTLFEPNVRQTWNAFSSRVTRFLSDVKVGFGLDDFKVLLDETTTTPELIDRNVMYAKILLKPTKAIEFIALDFVVTNDGAAFED